MPQSKFAADAFGAVSIFLIISLALLASLCIAYSFYFLLRLRSKNLSNLTFFSSPWIIRVTFASFVILWSLCELLRLTLIRRNSKALWLCKVYIVTNLGFTEPCLFLTLLFLLRAPLQGAILSKKWSSKTAAFVLLFCSPLFFLQLVVILLEPHFRTSNTLPFYFTSSTIIGLCMFPLLNTTLLGFFCVLICGYMCFIGRRIVKLVINKSLQKRVYFLIISVGCFLPLRVAFIGLSVLSKPEFLLFESLVFFGFLSLLCCCVICMCVVVYYPVADALALASINVDENNDLISLIDEDDAATSFVEVSLLSSVRNSSNDV